MKEKHKKNSRGCYPASSGNKFQAAWVWNILCTGSCFPPNVENKSKLWLASLPRQFPESIIKLLLLVIEMLAQYNSPEGICQVEDYCGSCSRRWIP